MKNSLVIEFVGLAGVGKTTLCNKLLERLMNENINCYKLEENIPLKNKISLQVFLRSFYITIKSNPGISKRLVINLKNLYVSQIRIKYAKNRKGIHLSDQGVFQVLGTLRKYSRSKHGIQFSNKKIDKLILPDLLIILKAESEMISKQRYERDGVNELEDIQQGQKRQIDLIEDAKYISTLKKEFKYLIFLKKDNNTDSILKTLTEILNSL